MGTGCSTGYALDPGIGEIPNFKIVLVGDAEAGKTSVFMRYFKNQFDYSYRTTTTVSIENVVKKLNVPEHTVVSLAMWDLPGREEMDLRQSYYKDVDAAIVVVNIADEESVELAGTWKQDILNHAVITKKQVVDTPEGWKVVTDYEPADHTQIPVLLLGNKYDLVEDRLSREEEKEDGDGNDSLLIEDNRDAEERSELPAKDADSGDAGESTMRSDGDGDGDKSSLHDDRKNERVEDDGEKEVTVWKYEEQQEEEEELPQEMQFLEEIAEKHGFVGSVAVSAKKPDGGVHEAIQALIRHLIERKLKDRAEDKMAAVKVKRAKVKRKRQKKHDPKAFEPLNKTGIKELDNLFNKCNRHMSLIHEARLAYRRAVRLFKTQCMEAEMVEEGPKCSMEDCVGGLKAHLAQSNLELLTEDENGFVALLIQGEEMTEEEKSEDVRDLLNTFHSEVAVASRTILHECPAAITALQELDAQVEADCTGALERAAQANPLTTRELKRVQDAVDMNRARVKHACVQAHDCLQDVESSYKKVKAAMIW